MSLLHLIDTALIHAGRGGECAVLAGIFALLFCSPDVRRLLQCAPRGYVGFLCVFFAVTLAAQVGTRGQYIYPQRSEPFPFTRFAMFTDVARSEQSETVTYHFVGRTTGDESVVLNPLHL